MIPGEIVSSHERAAVSTSSKYSSTSLVRSVLPRLNDLILISVLMLAREQGMAGRLVRCNPEL